MLPDFRWSVGVLLRKADEMGTSDRRQMHDISSNCGWANTGTSTGAALTGRALHHSDRYQKLNSLPIPRWGVGRGR